MQKIKDNIFEILTIATAILGCTAFWYCHGNISTDVGREAMMSLSVLKGEILYKDILNIYAPMSYYINALFMRVFGVKLESLYLSGALCSIIFLFTLFKISNKFFEKPLSFAITLFVATTCIYNSRLYNFILPYSYGVIFGLTSYAISLYFLLNYKDTKTSKDLCLCSTFAGIAFANKIEFLPIFLITLIVLFINKAEIKKILLSVSMFLIAPIIFYGIPFVQGLKTDDAIYAINIFKKSSVVPSVVEFAKQTGALFRGEDVIFWGISIIFCGLFLLISVGLFKTTKNKMLLFVAFLITAVVHFISKGETHFTYLPVATAIIVIWQYKNLVKHPKFLILTIGAIGASLKTFFYLNTDEYGAYTLPLLLVSAFAMLFLFEEKISEKIKFSLSKFSVFVLLAASLSNCCYAAQQLNMYNTKIITEKGRIDTRADWANCANSLIKYIEENTSPDDKILFLQEGALFNFLSERSTDMRTYALNMPYIETYGEEKIVEIIKSADFEYITILDGFGLYDFNRPKYYFSENSITQYIRNEYTPIYAERTQSNDSAVILKKK